MRTNFHVRPATLREAIASDNVARPPARLVLGLDLGSSCGFAYAYVARGVTIGPKLISRWHLGQLDLSAGSYESGAIRFVKLRHFLAAVSPDLVVYEDVKFTATQDINRANANAVMARISTSAEFLGALKATVCTWCEECGVPCTGFKIGTIKKRATGRGNASKEDMIEAANVLFGAQLEVEGYEATGVDNVADASFVCLLGLEQYADGLEGVSGAEKS